MTFKLSKNSRERLSTCDSKLQDLVNAVLEEFDVAVVCGHRNEEEQNKAKAEGFSNAKFGQSPHNTFPSRAVDLWPSPQPRLPDGQLDDHSKLWDEMANVVKKKAKELGLTIKWGGDFSYFIDKPHFELL